MAINFQKSHKLAHNNDQKTVSSAVYLSISIETLTPHPHPGQGREMWGIYGYLEHYFYFY